MSTRSSARNLFSPLDNPELTIRRRSCTDPTLLNDFEMATEGNSDPPVPDLRTMKELCQPSLNGWGGPIASIAIQATKFGLKNDMIQQSIKVNGVTDDALRLYLFPHSLTHHATAWFVRLPRNSINTFRQMAKMFLGIYFPPSMVTRLRNEITNFHQRPNESLFEAWECYKLSIDRCPNHNMFPVTQIDTFYNELTLRHHDTINAAAGGTFLKRCPKECYDLIENMTAHHNDWDTSAQRSESSSSTTSSSDTKIAALKAKMAKINKNLMRVLQVKQQVKAVTPNCETYGGPHSYTDCPATVGQTQTVYAVGAYQGNSYQPQGELTLHVSKEAITFNLDQTSRYTANYNDITVNRIDVIYMACEEYSQEVLSFSNMIAKVDTFLALEDDATSPKFDQSYFDPEGDILLLEAFINDDPSLPSPTPGNYLPQVRKELKICEAKNDKSSIDEPLEVEPQDLPPHLEYAFLEGDDKLPS
nr:reverse transcriptase domain-containing protein [Tanacetum cinerariifolium]